MRPEHWWYTLPLRLRSVFRRERADRELDEEMQFHLEKLIEEGVASGLSPRDARYAALRAMGGLAQKKEEARDMRGTRWLTDFLDDIRYAARSLARAPGLSFFVVLTLALGIGMASAPMSMVDALVFRPYPVPHPDRIVNLRSTSPYSSFELFSYAEYRDIAARAKSYTGVIANGDYIPMGYSLKSGETARVRGGMLVSGNYFSVLDVTPQFGRAFRPEEDQVPGRDPVVVLGRDFWKQELASDRTIVGRTIRLNGTVFTVIGVAPESFPGMHVFIRPDFYVPFAMAPVLSRQPQKDFFHDRDARGLIVQARLAPRATLTDARNELATIAKDFEREHPQFNRNRGGMVRNQVQMRTRSDDPNWKFGIVFLVLALMVLAVACTNAASLLLSRAGARRREIAVRLALGAGRSRLIRMLLAESLLLAVMGGAAGVAAGFALIKLLTRFAIPTTLPIHVPFQMDLRILAGCAALSVASAIVFGLAPALQSTRVDVVDGLKAGEAELPGRRRLWGRNVLVAGQVAASLTMLTAGLLVMRGFHHGLVEGVDFAKTAKDHVLMATFDPRLLQYDSTRTERFFKQLVEHACQAPGVVSAGLTQNPPLGLEAFEVLPLVPEGAEMPKDRETYDVTMDTVDEGYFDAMGIPIVRGRAFRSSDTRDTPRVAVVNESFATHHWPGVDALGKRFHLGKRGGPLVEIVGITPTLRYRMPYEKPMEFVYLPLAQRPVARLTLLMRSSGNPLSLIEPLKGIVRSIDPDLPLVSVRSYMVLYRYNAVDGPGIAVKMSMTMGAMALFLAVAGLYGLISYNVSRRTREIGIRMAVGADRPDVIRLVLGKGLVLVTAGAAIGLALGFGVEQVMNTALFNIGGVDFLVYAIVVPATFLVTTLAAYVPALRASRIEPTRALRWE
jgi:predicted permease